MNPPKIFGGSSNPNLAKSLSQKSKITLGQIEIGRFADGEIDVWVKDDVNNSNVFVLQSLSNPVNENIIELALICDALKRSGAHRINAITPYLAYGRKEKQARKGEPISAKVIAEIIVKSGVDKVICLDLHADAIVGFFDVPVISLSAQEVLAKKLNGEKLQKPIVVAPDVGGVRRARNFASLLDAPLAVIEKHRHTHLRDHAEVLSMSGEVSGDTAIIIDDVISTGGTIIEAAQALKGKGVKKVIVCATHGVFAGDAIKKLNESVIDKIIVTDSIGQIQKSPKIEVVSVSDLIASTLQEEI